MTATPAPAAADAPLEPPDPSGFKREEDPRVYWYLCLLDAVDDGDASAYREAVGQLGRLGIVASATGKEADLC